LDPDDEFSESDMFSIPRSSSFLFFEADFDVDEEVVEDILAVCELNCKLLGVLSI
jgi:hypothetical protein